MGSSQLERSSIGIFLGMGAGIDQVQLFIDEAFAGSDKLTRRCIFEQTHE